MTAMYRLEMRRRNTQPPAGTVGSLGIYPTLKDALKGLDHVAIAQPGLFDVTGGQFRLVVKAV